MTEAMVQAGPGLDSDGSKGVLIVSQISEIKQDWYLDSLLDEKNSDQHAKELSGKPSEAINDRCSIEYRKQN